MVSLAMVANIRRYKGAPAIPPARPQPITLDGRFEDWAPAEPQFAEPPGQAVQRSSRGYGRGSHYENRTGRNDIIATRVSFDRTNLYFYARTQAPLTPSSGSNLMLLFLDTDQNARTGWLGYDFVVNHSGVQAQTTTLEHNLGGFHWGQPEEVSYRAAGNELELAIPRVRLGLTNEPVRFDFKWADNIQQTGEADDFMLNGDVAPPGRFNYRYLGP